MRAKTSSRSLPLAAALMLLAASAGKADLIDFTPGFPTTGTNPFTYQGVTFTNQGGGSGLAGLDADDDWGPFFDNIPGASLGNALNDGWGTTDLFIDFGREVENVSILLSTEPVTTYTMNAFNASNTLIGSTTVTMPGDRLAVQASLNIGGITRIEILETNGENGNTTIFDDIRFTPVPEPGSLALLGLGGIGLLVAYRRRVS